MKCQFCGKELPDDARFCSACGKPVPQKKICPECGYEAEDDMIFCIRCGTRLTPGRDRGTSADADEKGLSAVRPGRRAAYGVLPVLRRAAD